MLKLLKPPIFADERKTHQAFLLHVILWSLIILPVPYLLYTVATNGNIERVLIQTAIGESVNLILLILFRTGHLTAASLIQTFGLLIFFLSTAYRRSPGIPPADILNIVYGIRTATGFGMLPPAHWHTIRVYPRAMSLGSRRISRHVNMPIPNGKH